MAVHRFPARANLLEASLVRASVWPSEWRSVLKRLDEMFPGGAAALRAVDLDRTAMDTPAWALGRRSLDDVASGTIFRLREIAEAQALAWGEMPDGRCGGAGLVIHREANRLWTIAVHLPEAEAPGLEAPLAALLARFAPIIRDSFAACRNVVGAGLGDMGAIRRCWDKAPFGVALITTCLRPVVANIIADDLFAVRGLFGPMGRSGRLRPATKAGDERLQRAVERILENPGARTSLDIGQPWSSERLTIRLEALSRDAETAFLRRGGRADDRLIATFHSPGRMATLADLSGHEGRRPMRASRRSVSAGDAMLSAAEPVAGFESGDAFDAAI